MNAIFLPSEKCFLTALCFAQAWGCPKKHFEFFLLSEKLAFTVLFLLSCAKRGRERSLPQAGAVGVLSRVITLVLRGTLASSLLGGSVDAEDTS